MATPEPQQRREVRLERMLAPEVRAAMELAPVAWVPWGALEYHAEHLPYGTDGFSAHALLERAAQQIGGVVLPWTALTIGTLHLEWTFRYDAALVEEMLRQTLRQLADHGARVAVVHTGHGPLDLAHLIKRVCAEVEAEAGRADDFRAYGLCYLELNAALGAGLGSEWPVAIDHGSIVETSWVMAMQPDLVQLDRLPQEDDPAPIVGVYGPNPRGHASAELGRTQLESCAALLAQRVAGLVAGEQLDTMADLRTFVERYWPEELELSVDPESDATALRLANPAPVSRYLTSLAVHVDGETMPAQRTRLVNATAGESGVALTGSELGPERGFYLRRGQHARVDLPIALEPGRHRIVLELGLAGVATTRLERHVELN